jgi:23S rRNA pseudouridine2605 synthase
MRLNRFLAACGLGSRRQCDVWITEGKVTINRQQVKELATTVAKSDLVMFQGKEVKPDATVTVLLHKPPGVLCTKNDPKKRPTIYDLLPPPLQNLHYVGRLDSESEGLLLLTNDGDLTQLLTHPSHATEKEYWVILNRSFRHEDTAALKAGMMLEEGLAKADKVDIITPRHLSVVLHQGLNRQIRRMFELLNYEVVRLVRIRIGGLDIGQLKPGKFRHLHEPDFVKLHQGSSGQSPKGKPAAYPTHQGAKPGAAKGKRIAPVKPFAGKAAKKAARPERPERPFGTPRPMTVPTSFEDSRKADKFSARKSARPGASSRAPSSAGRAGFAKRPGAATDGAASFRSERPDGSTRRPERPTRSPKSSSDKSRPTKPSAGGRYGKGSGNAKPDRGTKGRGR